ncbi:MAG: hypothetical protein CMD08_01480, partial [Flavobacteriales bacterium]|nr:hypothetical protein [Flavobacteriales bacterium]
MKLLREHYKELLSEEIDYSSKVATVYHLTGFKTAQYDPVYAKLNRKTPKELESEIDAKYKSKPKSRAQSILSKAEYKVGLKDLKKYKTSAGQAYHIARNIQSSLFDAGSYFQAGSGAAYGKGLYTCYRLNPKIAQTYGNVILRFEVDISNFLIFNEGIARKIHGNDHYTLDNQFMQILKRKGFNLVGHYEHSDSVEMSSDAEESLSDYVSLLNQMSSSDAFKNSDFNTNIRTADMANHALYEFSKQFKNGSALKLRDIVDGVIFYGYSDGPVCVIYHPESLGTYKLTGAGYFKQNRPVIESDIEALVGRTGKDFTSSFQSAQELDQDAQDRAEERNQKFKDVLAQYAVDASSSEEEFINNIPSELTSILEPLRLVLEDNVPEDIMIERLRSTPQWDKFLQDMADSYHYIQCIVSILAGPMLKFIEHFGPGLEIINSDEFKEYCKLFRQYAQNKSTLDSLNQTSNTPKLADFESRGLKCVAQNEEEFSNLVKQYLSRLVKNYNSMLQAQIGAYFVDFVTAAMLDGESGNINNSIGSCSLTEITINTDNDKKVVESHMPAINKKLVEVQNKLIEFITKTIPENVQSSAGIDAVRQAFKYSDTVNADGKIYLDEIIDRYGWYSDWCHAGS